MKSLQVAAGLALLLALVVALATKNPGPSSGPASAFPSLMPETPEIPEIRVGSLAWDETPVGRVALETTSQLEKGRADLLIQVHSEEDEVPGQLKIHCIETYQDLAYTADYVSIEDPVTVRFLDDAPGGIRNHEHGPHCRILVALETDHGQAEEVFVEPAARGPREVTITLPPIRTIDVHLLGIPQWLDLEVMAALVPDYTPLEGNLEKVNEDGRIQFTDVALSRAYLCVELSSTEHTSGGYSVVSRLSYVFDAPLDLTGPTSYFQLSLPQFEEVSGVASGCLGQPLGPGHPVGLYTGWGEDTDAPTSITMTDENGRFSLRVPAGQAGLITTGNEGFGINLNFSSKYFRIINGPIPVVGGDRGLQVRYHQDGWKSEPPPGCSCETLVDPSDFVEIPLEVVNEEGVRVQEAGVVWFDARSPVSDRQSAYLALHQGIKEGTGFDGTTLRIPSPAGRGVLWADEWGGAILDGAPAVGTKIQLRHNLRGKFMTLSDARTELLIAPTGVQIQLNDRPISAKHVGPFLFLPDAKLGDRIKVTAPGYFAHEFRAESGNRLEVELMRMPR